MGNAVEEAGAIIEGDYRYRLWRQLEPDNPRRVLFVMFNPSTADSEEDDPTLRRVMHFARQQHAGRVDVVNLYAVRTPHPIHVETHPDPIGEHTDKIIEAAAAQADLVVLGWGALRSRDRATRIDDVIRILLRQHKELYRLGRTTKGGDPRHPLYLANSTKLELHVRRD